MTGPFKGGEEGMMLIEHTIVKKYIKKSQFQKHALSGIIYTFQI